MVSNFVSNDPINSRILIVHLSNVQYLLAKKRVCEPCILCTIRTEDVQVAFQALLRRHSYLPDYQNWYYHKGCTK